LVHDSAGLLFELGVLLIVLSLLGKIAARLSWLEFSSHEFAESPPPRSVRAGERRAQRDPGAVAELLLGLNPGRRPDAGRRHLLVVVRHRPPIAPVRSSPRCVTCSPAHSSSPSAFRAPGGAAAGASRLSPLVAAYV
jgi:hypothetical protein